MKKALRYTSAGLLFLSVCVLLNNTSLLASRPAGAPELLAHRGGAQQFAPGVIDKTTQR